MTYVCLNRGEMQPWLRSFDVFNNSGYQRPDGQIDSYDVDRWHSNLDVKFQTGISNDELRCVLFRWDMIRQHCLQYIEPEMGRTGPLQQGERERRAGEAVEVMAHHARELSRHFEAFLSSVNRAVSTKADKTPPIMGEAMSVDILPVTYRVSTEIGADDFETIRNMYWQERTGIQLAAIEYLLSLHFDSSKLAGLGIGFTKKDSQCAVITVLDTGTALEKPTRRITPGKTEITAIDGKSTLEMSHDEVRNALRGPHGSRVTLTLQNPGVEAWNESLRRTWVVNYLR